MKTAIQLKKPYGNAAFSRVRHARYLSWEDAFDVEFEDGLCFCLQLRRSLGCAQKFP